MKYVMFQCLKGGGRVPFVFPESQTHSEVAKSLEGIGLFAVSAGFVGFGEALPEVCGHSESLGMSPGPMDGARIAFGDSCNMMDDEMISSVWEAYKEKVHAGDDPFKGVRNRS